MTDKSADKYADASGSHFAESLLVALIWHLLWLEDVSHEGTSRIFDEIFFVGDEIGQLTEGY